MTSLHNIAYYIWHACGCDQILSSESQVARKHKSFNVQLISLIDEASLDK